MAASSGSTARSAAPPPAPAFVVVPKAAPPPVIDGEIDEPAWPSSGARTGAFVDGVGAAVRPYSDARFLWHDGALDILLYAADEDIRSATDAFTVTLIAGAKTARYRVGPKGLIADPSADDTSKAVIAGAKFGVDLDGTIDKPDDDDEEWVIESTIPLAPLGLTGRAGENLQIAIERCDTPKHGTLVCGHFGTAEAPKTLQLR